MQPPPAAETIKEQVEDRTPKRIGELQFGILSQQDIVKQSVLQISHEALYHYGMQDGNTRLAVDNGPLDRRLGCAPKSDKCPTCDAYADRCNGHFGYCKLVLPAYHVGYLKLTTAMLQQICKSCSHILLSEQERRDFLKKVRRPGLDNLARRVLCKKILTQCKKAGSCFNCGATNGTIKKAGAHPLKIIHDKYRKYNSSHAISKVKPRSKVSLEESFKNILTERPDLEKHQSKVVDDLNPLKVLNLFRRINAPDCELLGMDPTKGRPEMFIWQYVPAPPNAIRPSIGQEAGTTEDDLTVKYQQIVTTSLSIQSNLLQGNISMMDIMEKWDYLQLQLAIYINSDVPGVAQTNERIRGFCQRLKGKQGRFRGNLSGKRVDFSGRTVISPDPNLAINEVAIPIRVAMNLTYPEKVTAHNIEKLKRCIKNGPKVYPGAMSMSNRKGKKFSLKYNVEENMQGFRVGWTVERHLEDGDIVLFNRQPSLHKLSILCHFVKVRPHRTFRLNECVCNPYNADFDGDEMNLHVPQTEEARAEAIHLMGVKHNLVTPKNGEPIIAAIQDFITASYLLSNKDVFYDRKTFTNICMAMVDGNMQIDLPPPAIFKPEMLWTGKQVFNVMMRPNKRTEVFVNLEAPCREYKAVKGQPRDLDENDAWLCVRNSEIMCGVMDKSTIGSGKKDSIFFAILRDFGPDEAIMAMGRLAKLSSRWLTDQGFSIGINDVTPGENLKNLKGELIEKAYAECDELIVKFKEGKLAKSAGCDEETTLENQISGLLSNTRGAAGQYCVSELSRHNAPLAMANSGSKGSHLNVAQMVATVGQQVISGKRVEEGFEDRTLPHFPKNAKNPPSKGFVSNSFYSGLNPSEFLFHAMSGREGLVDTAVKTAETGYMSRRLVKALEDLSSQYDNTVRNSSMSVVQFRYGDDLLDPVNMEGKAKPVNFERTFIHCEAVTRSNSNAGDDHGLLPGQIETVCNKLLAVEEAKYPRHPYGGAQFKYYTQEEVDTDQFESARTFLESLRQFVWTKRDEQIKARERLGLSLAGHATIVAGKGRGRASAKAKSAKQQEITLNQVHKLSKRTLETFIRTCLRKYDRAEVEPGHAVGVVGAQSIGEPGTQMTLKTFHFAGVAGMSITEGVPRIKEIINASEKISTPIITCQLNATENMAVAARIVKGTIEKTYIGDILSHSVRHHTRSSLYLSLHIDFPTIQRLRLRITTTEIARRIQSHKKLKLPPHSVVATPSEILIYAIAPPEPKTRDSISTAPSKPSSSPPTTTTTPKRPKKPPFDAHHRLDVLERLIPKIIITGYPSATRAVIAVDTHNSSHHRVLVEGYGLRECMSTPGVSSATTRTNSVIETFRVLGIEAARKTIVDEISIVMRTMDIDPRHMQLLADVMTYKGEVLGITRFGLAKMRDSVLQLASFEKTPDHLFEAAAMMKRDGIKGVSECIIVGKEMGLGTGGVGVVRDLGLDLSEGGEVGRWREEEGGKGFEECWEGS